MPSNEETVSTNHKAGKKYPAVLAVNSGYLYTLFCALLGIVLLIAPDKTMEVIFYVVAFVLVFYGCIRVIRYFSNPASEAREHQVMAHGMIIVFTGALLAIYNESIRSLIWLIAGAVMLFVAAIRMQAGFDQKRMNGKYWYIQVAAAILQIGCAIALLGWHEQLINSVAMLLGILLLVEAAVDLVNRLTMIRLEKKKIHQAEQSHHVEEQAAVKDEPELQSTDEPEE